MPDEYRRRLQSLLFSFYKEKSRKKTGYFKEDFFEDSDYRKFYRKLYFKIFRHLGYTEYCIKRFAKRLDDDYSKSFLVMGAAQILFMEDVPDYASINETVKSAPKRLKKFINAVLRNIARNKDELLNDYHVKYDFPGWFVDKWYSILSSENDLYSFLEKLNTTPDFYSIKLNTLSAENFSEHATDNYSMDLASFYIPMLTKNLESKNILDVCAAPGGKTIVLSKLHPEAKITALEKHHERYGVLKRNLKDKSCSNVDTINSDFFSFNPEYEKTFDLILLDAPCSALGTIRKHPEIRWLRTPENIDTKAKQQKLFLEHASKMVSDNGRLLYSVCSLEPEEGEKQIEEFLSKNSNFESIMPDRAGISSEFFQKDFFYSNPLQTDTDGFFGCLLQKM